MVRQKRPRIVCGDGRATRLEAVLLQQASHELQIELRALMGTQNADARVSARAPALARITHK
jgi:hypothetical protein